MVTYLLNRWICQQRKVNDQSVDPRGPSYRSVWAKNINQSNLIKTPYLFFNMNIRKHMLLNYKWITQQLQKLKLKSCFGTDFVSLIPNSLKEINLVQQQMTRDDGKWSTRSKTRLHETFTMRSEKAQVLQRRKNIYCLTVSPRCVPTLCLN